MRPGTEDPVHRNSNRYGLITSGRHERIDNSSHHHGWVRWVAAISAN